MIERRFAVAAAALALLAACSSQPSSRSAPTAVPTASASASASAKTVSAGTPHTLLLISIDGLRADMLDRGITPNLSQLAREGVRARWMTPSYPSLTFPNHYTLVTGLRPDHHGIVHNSMRDPALGSFWLSKPEAVGDARWWGGEPVWVGVEKAGQHAATWSWPGSEAAIAGVRPTRWRHYEEHTGMDARVDEVRGWLAASGAARNRLVTLYFEHVDEAGHDHGPQSREYADSVRAVDAAIGRLLDGMQRDGTRGRTNIIVVSDHGMAEVAPGHAISVEAMAPPQIAGAVTDGQVIGFAPMPGQQAAAEASLLGKHAHYECWRKAQLPARWHYGSHPRIPAIVCQMHEGWDALFPNKLAKRAQQGMRGSHGFDPALPSMRAVFLAQGPDLAQGKTLPGFDNVDVYALMTRLLGIPAAPNDGNPATLLPALRVPPAAGTE
ncbi:ectonucleotide pyrophosphatase/phosphodiesterase [Xanthomonas nasturtii]|uniref:Ectonucleotide pyrophosphatase/phosphodiesterase n=1 Tax=Xanthomonas nasturtii TaxID=1843581 RepID=A0ABT0LQC7_9XANT|nr:ectonucleotide pyrophosphatase/phosphodiesterase [Xanthomonas nasturtii]MCL1500109.1 ectonucleotide pyrophosphatase/phosphodiesterase [Xanthomonas nasturtii]MCL1503853.1 ectonucleotide pyrophosphatase/phosphodiesterase [Xanthomonas nasturtii]MCL1523681.1 ectonucleotide pyrophosphatase/phosphodiesterase [Xanthomonas nasturtii]MCL1551536.1 ectonucleotide pyrophosphatase/phosphodiesterase [Xanthomonas nasturtii]MCL1555883.1 ectonucleotide pyrophosphatase/phosphodiesterase [Xanthomonas nasturti